MALADVIPAATSTILSSSRRVAAQTARSIAAGRSGEVAVLLDDGLVEVGRPDDVSSTDPVLVRRYLSGEELDGWEPHEAAIARFRGAVQLAMRADIRARAIVSHGLIMALWMAPRLGTTPLTVWEGLGHPDVWRYDAATGRIRRS